MPRDPKERIEQLKTFFNVKKDKELGVMLSVSSNNIAQWKYSGFSEPAGNAIDAIMDNISCCDFHKRSGANHCPVCGKKIPKYTHEGGKNG